MSNNYGLAISLRNEIEVQLLCLAFLTTLDRLGYSPDDQVSMVEEAEQSFKHDFEAMGSEQRQEFTARIAITLAGATAIEKSGMDLADVIKQAAEQRERAKQKQREARRN